MNPVQLTDDIHWVGALDPDLRIFDIIMRSPNGTSYNAYLIKARKTALIDTVKHGFYEQLIYRVRTLIDPAQIDYIILNHTEPDHSGALKQLLNDAPSATVKGSRAAGLFLREIVNQNFRFEAVTHGETLDLGGKRLQFISAPNLHWPDSIFTYVPEDRVLFTCDAFGSHYCGPKLFDDEMEDFSHAFKYYFDHIIRPFKQDMLTAMNKIEELKINIIAPSHGPVLRTNVQRYIDKYIKWSQPPVCKQPMVVIVYVSVYGNTQQMAEAITQGVQQAGGKTKLYDAREIDAEQFRNDVECAQGLIVGSPTINGDAVKSVWDLLSSLATIRLKGKQGATYGSYAWSGEAAKLLADRLRGLKFKMMEPVLNMKLVPTAADLEQCRQFGRAFVEEI
jgi:flavorubredoxin